MDSPRMEAEMDGLPQMLSPQRHVRHSSHGASSNLHDVGRGGVEFSTLQREIEELKEYIASQDRQKSKPGKVMLFLQSVYDRLFHIWILSRPHLPPVRFLVGAIFAIIFVVFLFNIDNLPAMAQKVHRFVRKNVHRLDNPDTDQYTLAYNGYYYRTLRPTIEVDNFNNKHLDNGRSVLTCPIRFPVPKGWTLVPKAEEDEVVKNVVTNHYWSSSAMVLNKMDAYPTLSLLAQVSRPYPQANKLEPRTLPGLVNVDAFKGMGPWFDVTVSPDGQEWVEQNLLPVNTRECLMIVFSFASRGYRDDNVEDVVPACELCSTNILIRKLIDDE